MPRSAATPTASPGFDVTSLDSSGAFVRNAGLILDAIKGSEVAGHIDLTAAHHTPWGIVHGGVYASAVESAASIGATAAVRDQGQVAVGLTNTTHFLRSLTAGRVTVAEVEHLVDSGAIDPDHIHTPGVFVDRIVHATSLEKRIEQRTVRKRGD